MLSFTRAKALPVLLGACTLLAFAGCGGSSDAPTVAQLTADSLKAMQHEKSVHYDLKLDAEIEAADSAPAEARRVADNPLELRVQGGISPKAVTADGSAKAIGQTFTASALIGQHETYINFLGGWYGSKDLGLKDAEKQAKQASPAEFHRMLASIHKYGDRVIEGEIKKGDKVDGVETWKLEGTLDADGLADIAREQGEKVDKKELEEAREAFELIDITVVVGRDDKLPRLMEFEIEGDADDFKKLNQTGSSSELGDIEHMKASASLSLTKWGEKVEFDAPKHFEPLEQMFGGMTNGGVAPPADIQ